MSHKTAVRTQWPGECLWDLTRLARLAKASSNKASEENRIKDKAKSKQVLDPLSSLSCVGWSVFHSFYYFIFF